jgi:hypothetical protein
MLPLSKYFFFVFLYSVTELKEIQHKKGIMQNYQRDKAIHCQKAVVFDSFFLIIPQRNLIQILLILCITWKLAEESRNEKKHSYREVRVKIY